MTTVFGIDGFEGVFTVVPVLFWAAVVVALGWVVRRAVRHGVLDARRRRPSEHESSTSPWRR